VRKSVVDKIKEVRFYTIIADESWSSKTEQRPFCVHYADGLYVQERLLSFQHCCRQCDADGLSTLLRTAIQSEGLQNVLIVAQSYDGAAVMVNLCRLSAEHSCCPKSLAKQRHDTRGKPLIWLTSCTAILHRADRVTVYSVYRSEGILCWQHNTVGVSVIQSSASY